MKNSNYYKAFYKGKTLTVEAETSYKAQLKAADLFRARKSFDVAVVLVSSKGESVTHKPLF
jgi:hypothetical protein